MQDNDRLEKIASDKRYQSLKRHRSRLAWSLAGLNFGAFTVFTMAVALAKPYLGRPIGNLVITWGVPIGFLMIALAVVSIAYYTRVANSKFDDQLNDIMDEAGK